MKLTVEQLYAYFSTCSCVTIDSRIKQPKGFFLGLKGTHYNGGIFAAQALQNGAQYALVDDKKYVTAHNILLVEDVLQTLQKLATFHRRQYKGTLIALTGSNGKTTTKELLKKVLSQKYSVQATHGNLNNEIGVPLTLLSLKLDTQMAIIEMGANKVGDIAFLCEIAQPTHGLITNIGHAHTESFGGIAGVFKGKKELFDYLRNNQRPFFLNQNDKKLKTLSKSYDNLLLFPYEKYTLAPRNNSPFIQIQFQDKIFSSQLTGNYNYENILASLAIGSYFDIDDKALFDAIAHYKPHSLRSQFLKINSNAFILDAYNANPDSMKAAIDNLCSFEGKKVLVLGDMNELHDSKKAHLQLAHYIKSLPLDDIILIGKEMKNICRELPTARYFDNVENALPKIHFSDYTPSTILIKGSRSLQLEKLIQQPSP